MTIAKFAPAITTYGVGVEYVTGHGHDAGTILPEHDLGLAYNIGSCITVTRIKIILPHIVNLFKMLSIHFSF